LGLEQAELHDVWRGFWVLSVQDSASLLAHEQLKSFFLVGEFLEPFLPPCRRIFSCFGSIIKTQPVSLRTVSVCRFAIGEPAPAQAVTGAPVLTP
jgi:hypothetical protein